jgi:2-oxoglutarate dehydrogenase E2 component (dihydrolipoamide succinyltransferase)
VSGTASDLPLSPAVRRLVEENNLNAAAISGTGVDGRLTKADVLAHMKHAPAAPAAGAMPAIAAAPRQTPRPEDAAREERVPMSKLRQVIATRLKTAQHNAAMLTTFNEIDMSALMAMRASYRQEFEAAYGTRLGFMGMFVLASIQALQDFPAVNAEIDGTDIIYKNYYNIGVAVGTPQGLVVPVVRDAGAMNLAAIETQIADFGDRARNGKITPDDMAGGTFTISNGGVYGSLMSTPILNPPQSGILGMHKIEKRPVVIDDQVVIRSMMYLALSYDHRIIDGREAVSFLARIKELVEDPRRLVLGV